ncbi:MAG TPA: GatB/YqeY domain-containing protein [Rhizomicrobium sp.]|jgi:hypothetical protein|nr:GatB/YqeY domain-containing protein [Rhizomicrobium sp.]
MALRDDFTAAMKDAMRAKDAKRLQTVRLILSTLKDRDIAARTEDSREGIDDGKILDMLGKMIKQREESAAAYDAGNRPELAAAEREEIEVIRGFMPKQMSDDEVKAAIQAAIAETGATAMKDMGKVVAILRAKYAGQMDFGRASALAKDILSGK